MENREAGFNDSGRRNARLDDSGLRTANRAWSCYVSVSIIV